MKTLFLLRHGKASNDDPTLADMKRPLTDRGSGDAKLVSAALRKSELIPQKIISSPALRAVTTANIFASAFEMGNAGIGLDETLYDSYERDYMNAISSVSESFSSCLLVGHNDTISYVASRLLGKIVDPMKTCEVLVISSKGNTWSEFASSSCSLQLQLYPSLLKP